MFLYLLISASFVRIDLPLLLRYHNLNAQTSRS